jgi:hypothetical protein
MALGTPVQLAAGTSTTATTTCAFGSTPAAGTLLVLVVGADDYRLTSGAGRPESTGWALVTGGAQQTNLGHYMWYKLASGSESSVQYTIGSASPSTWQVHAQTGVDQTTPLDVSNGSIGTPGSFTNAPPAVTASAGNRTAFASLGAAHNPTAITGVGGWTNGYTEIGDTRTSPGSGTQDAIGVAYLNYTATGSASTTSTGTWAGTNPDANTGIIAVFKEAAGGSNVTDNAQEGSGLGWSGIRAASAAAVIGLASVGALSWSGVRANSSTATNVTDTAQEGALTWAGVRAQSAAGVTHQARVGGMDWAGPAPILSIEDVSIGSGPAALAWGGVRANSVAIGGGTTDTAQEGSGLAWSGIRAASAAAALHTAQVGALAWSGIRAGSAVGVVDTAQEGALTWAGVGASSAAAATHTAQEGTIAWAGVNAQSTTVPVTTDTARVGALAWGGVRAQSVVGGLATGTVGGVTWWGVPADTSSSVTSPTRLAGLLWFGVPADSTANNTHGHKRRATAGAAAGSRTATAGAVTMSRGATLTPTEG